MIRSKALAAVGGLPTDSVTEDYLLTLRFEELGWQSVYLNEPLNEGLAPEGMHEYIVQRARWCLGMMEFVRNSYNPFRRHRMKMMLRISVLDSLLYWTSTFWFRFAGLVCPLLYWYFGLTVVDARVSDVISYYLPFYVAIWAGLNWLSPGLIFPLLKDVSQLLPALAVMRATIMGLTSEGPHRFHVAAKGGDRSKVVVQWQLVRPFIIFLALTIGGLLLALVDPQFSYDQVAGDGITIILFWTIYNLLLIALTKLACVELPRTDRPLRNLAERVELRFGGSPIGGWLSELGLETALVRGPHQLAIAQNGTIEVEGITPMIATVSTELRNSYLLSLAPTAEQRQMLVARLHTQSGAPGVLGGSLSGMFRQLASSLNFR